jgi:general secretion pathway protein A
VRRHNRGLSSRLHARLRIEPLTPEDTAEYLRVRRSRAGCDRELFASDALARLHEAASGALRDVDRLATAAPREAARRRKKLVERDTLARVLDTVKVDEP